MAQGNPLHFCTRIMVGNRMLTRSGKNTPSIDDQDPVVKDKAVRIGRLELQLQSANPCLFAAARITALAHQLYPCLLIIGLYWISGIDGPVPLLACLGGDN